MKDLSYSSIKMGWGFCPELILGKFGRVHFHFMWYPWLNREGHREGGIKAAAGRAGERMHVLVTRCFTISAVYYTVLSCTVQDFVTSP